MAITIAQTVFETIPCGRYPAKIVAIVEEVGQFGPQLKFRFELPKGEGGSARILYGWTSKKFSNQSKLYDWTRAALGGAPIDPNYVFNSDDLIGKKVFITVLEEQSDRGAFNKIQSMFPYQPKTQQAPPPLQDPQDW